MDINANEAVDVCITVENETFDNLLRDLALDITYDCDRAIHNIEEILYAIKRQTALLERMQKLAMLAKEHETEINN